MHSPIVEEQRSRLMGMLSESFDLTPLETATVAEAFRRGGLLAEPMRLEVMLDHPIVTESRLPLSMTLSAYLVAKGVPTQLANLLSAKLRPGLQVIYYVLRNNEEYGVLMHGGTN